ncbi:MAG: CBS domain-containing protein [Candidatus Promineifilaceae bacterium]
MLLILTHENGDFDAIASQFAAHKLYSGGVPLLPQRVNRNVSQFLTLYWDSLPFVRREDWKRQRVDSVLLVDTQTFNSVRGMGKHPKVHVIDHHGGRERISGWHYEIEETGATTTILVEKLDELGAQVTPEEATLLLLGIYEDTGSLSYDTTTVRDVRAAAWLLEQGARLNVARRFLRVALTPAQQALYEALTQNVTWVEMAGQMIAVACATAVDGFDDEISSVAHRLRDVLSPAALIVLVQLGADVQLVARSASDFVDVSTIAAAFNGGGHSRAAAALITKMPLSLVKREVLSLLPRVVKQMATVAEIMSYGVQTLTADTAVSEAAALMQRFGYEGYPVVDENGRVIGLLTRRAVDRAMNHNMGHQPVSRIMKSGSIYVYPSDSIRRVQQLMLDEGWGQIPVVSDETADPRPIGIVTRTDLLNHLFQPTDTPGTTNLRTRLQTALPAPLWGLVLAASRVAEEMKMPLYFVGGPVRDLLLGLPPVDLDMVVEGDAIALVAALQAKFGGEFHTHERFGTAKWLVMPEIWQQLAQLADETAVVDPKTLPTAVDFVTARTEFYTEPSALPQIARGSIKLDLHRRDFALNTLAVRLDGAYLGRLLDFYGGLRDLEQKQIRVLHSLSFVDDPTRILRAVRLAARLEFEIEARTAELLVNSLPMLDRVTGSRIRHEIELALREVEPARILAEFDAWGILRQIHPALAWDTAKAPIFARLPKLLAEPEWYAALGGESPVFVYFALWLAGLPVTAQEEVMARLHVRKSTRDDILSVGRAVKALYALPKDAKPSVVARTLRPFNARVLLVCRVYLVDERLVEWVERYYREWRFVETAVDGYHLQKLGLKPGPIFTVILDKLLAARLDGEVQTREEEDALLQTLLAELAG